MSGRKLEEVDRIIEAVKKAMAGAAAGHALAADGYPGSRGQCGRSTHHQCDPGCESRSGRGCRDCREGEPGHRRAPRRAQRARDKRRSSRERWGWDGRHREERQGRFQRRERVCWQRAGQCPCAECREYRRRHRAGQQRPEHTYREFRQGAQECERRRRRCRHQDRQSWHRRGGARSLRRSQLSDAKGRGSRRGVRRGARG